MAWGRETPCRAASVRYPARSPCAENASGSRPATAQPLDDQIDRLRRERLLFHRFPAVDRPEDRPLRDVGPFQAFAQRLDRRADQKRPALLVGVAVLVRPSSFARHGSVDDLGSRGSSRACGSSLNCSTRSRATSLRRRPPEANARSRIARSRVSAKRSVAQVAISRSRTSRVTARLLLRWRGRGEARTANRSAERRLGAANGPRMPFQRCNVLQLARHRLTVFGVSRPHNAASRRPASYRRRPRASRVGGRSRASRVDLALRGVPEMMRHEFQRERLVAGHDSGWPAAAFAQASK
jgi:hypothetical protein